MDRDFFLNAGLHFEPPSQLPSWKLMPVINEQSHVDRFNNFESNFSSIGSSPVSPVSNSVAQKLNWPIIPDLRNSTPFDTNLPSLLTDPGFAERAAKLSCFGSRSFNDRTSQFGLNSNNPDSQFRSTVIPLIGHSKLPRVSSSQSLKISGSTMMIQETKISHEIHTLNGLGNENKSSSNEESSVSQQMEIANSRKRKAASFKGKAKEIVSVVVKEEGNDELNFKKVKKTEDDVTDKTEKSKLPEPPKDYIHVRARRGQATDSHSLAERVRREKIGERMKLLQDLVPGCNKVIGKALMLDEIITYVQSLQHQVEFLSMKLATMNPRQEFDMNNHISKDMNQSNGNLCHQLYPMESSTSDFYQQQTRQQPQQQQVLFIGSAPITQSSVDPLNPVLGFTENFSQFAGFEGDDLHSLVKMGFGENRNQTPDMKVEL